MFRRYAILFVVVTLLAIALAPVVSAQDPEKPIYYYVSHGGPADPFWGVVVKGVEDAGRDLGVDARYVGPAGVFSLQEMIDILNTAVGSEPAGIASTIVDPEALDEPLRRAIDMGIPVVGTNAADTRPPEEAIPYMFYVGALGYDGGLMGGKYMLEQGEITRAVCPTHEAGHSDHIARCQGFKDALAPEGIEVDDLDIGQDPTQAVEVFKAYFEANPETNAMLTLGPPGLIPAVQWMKESGKEPGEIMHGAFDLGVETLDAISDGYCMFAIDQQQYLQGYLSIWWLHKFNEHALKPPGDVKTGPFFVTADNIAPIADAIERGYR